MPMPCLCCATATAAAAFLLPAIASATLLVVATCPCKAEAKKDEGGGLDALVNTVLMMAIVGILAWKVFEGGQPKKKDGNKAAAGGGRSLDEGADDGYYEDDVDDDGGGHQAPPPAPEEPEAELSEYEIGEEMELPVEDLHFGLPRCKVTMKPSMPTMLKWTAEDFDKQERLEVARVHIGTFGVWVVQGLSHNRSLYAMKKGGKVETAKCVTVEPPPPKTMEDEDNDTPDTYGPDISKIQLIP
jgi:hypothetical protein